MTRVLVIIVSYRSAKLALDAVSSVEAERARTGLDLRAVVVENASGDEEALRAGLVGREGVSLVVSQRNGGFAYGNNRGFAFGYETGFVPDYFHLLNPDARLLPGAVLELVKFLQGNPGVGIAGSSLVNPDGSDWSRAFRFPTLASEVDRGLRVGVVSRLLRRWVVAREMSAQAEQIDWAPGASMMIRREVIEQVGGLDEQYFLYFEETDFCLKARRHGWTCWYVPASRVMHIAGQSTGVTDRSSLPKRYPAYWFESRRRFFAKNYGVPYAFATDVAALTAATLGGVVRAVKRNDSGAVPKFVPDLALHSVLPPSRWQVSPEECFRAPPR